MSGKFKIKICGNVFPEDSLKTASFLPDYMGWIFSPASPRRVPLARAQKLVEIIRDSYPSIKHVGVFAHNSVSEIANAHRSVHFDHLQIVDGAGLIGSAR